MDLENKVKQQLLSRGFTKEQLLNNRGLIGVVIDEAALMIVKNLGIQDVRESLPTYDELVYALKEVKILLLQLFLKHKHR